MSGCRIICEGVGNECQNILKGTSDCETNRSFFIAFDLAGCDRMCEVGSIVEILYRFFVMSVFKMSCFHQWKPEADSEHFGKKNSKIFLILDLFPKNFGKKCDFSNIFFRFWMEKFPLQGFATGENLLKMIVINSAELEPKVRSQKPPIFKEY